MFCQRTTIRRLTAADFGAVDELVNEALQAYGDFIPADCSKIPFTLISDLHHTTRCTIRLWGIERDGRLHGVMGLQNSKDVTLIRHPYVRNGSQRQGIGSHLLQYLQRLCARPMLARCWPHANSAIRFYQKHGFEPLPTADAEILQPLYWPPSAPPKKRSTILADSTWREIYGSFRIVPAKSLHQ